MFLTREYGLNVLRSVLWMFQSLVRNVCSIVHSNFRFGKGRKDSTLSRVTQKLDMSDVAFRYMDQPFVINDYHTELSNSFRSGLFVASGLFATTIKSG